IFIDGLFAVRFFIIHCFKLFFPGKKARFLPRQIPVYRFPNAAPLSFPANPHLSLLSYQNKGAI
ncbi:MAG: hypothetical protein IJ214_03965, partial [Clostridia bacterium]|nr:hypothetical protein [Clostridia bacterium]